MSITKSHRMIIAFFLAVAMIVSSTVTPFTAVAFALDADSLPPATAGSADVTMGGGGSDETGVPSAPDQEGDLILPAGAAPDTLSVPGAKTIDDSAGEGGDGNGDASDANTTILLPNEGSGSPDDTDQPAASVTGGAFTGSGSEDPVSENPASGSAIDAEEPVSEEPASGSAIDAEDPEEEGPASGGAVMMKRLFSERRHLLRPIT